jgi:hypothetical protein
MDRPQAQPFIKLSAVLEKQLETVIANQRLLLAMHETLKHLLPKYETEVLDALASPPSPKKPQQDGNQMWEAMAKKTLLELRNYKQ